MSKAQRVENKKGLVCSFKYKLFGISGEQSRGNKFQSFKGKTVNILGFVGFNVSVAMSLLPSFAAIHKGMGVVVSN